VALNALEASAELAGARGDMRITLPDAQHALARRAMRYDKKQDRHYDIISAFIKSLRGSDPDAGLYWLAEMIEGGEDPRFIARRMIILASEDVGMADAQALPIAVAAAHAVEHVGLPEAALNLAHAVVYLALAPKSRGVTRALTAATEDARERSHEVPAHLKGSDPQITRKLAREGKGYKFPPDRPAATRDDQEYRPPDLEGRRYYEPDSE
jgi:putative ATPase